MYYKIIFQLMVPDVPYPIDAWINVLPGELLKSVGRERLPVGCRIVFVKTGRHFGNQLCIFIGMYKCYVNPGSINSAGSIWLVKLIRNTALSEENCKAFCFQAKAYIRPGDPVLVGYLTFVFNEIQGLTVPEVK